MKNMKKLVYYTHVCAPCNDQTYHYYETLNACSAAGYKVDNRYIAVMEQWKKEAEAFGAPLPILYNPEKQVYLSIGNHFDKAKLDKFLALE